MVTNAESIVPRASRTEVEYDSSPILAFMDEHATNFGAVQFETEFKFYIRI